MIKCKKYRNVFRPIVRFIKFRILHVDDSPRNIAMGVGIGFFVAWLPLIGLHTIIALAMSIPVKANKFLALTCVWVSNVFTLIPVYLPSYLIGRMITDLFNIQHNCSQRDVIDLLKRLGSINVFTDIWTADFWHSLGQMLVNIWLPLCIGTAIIAPLVALLAYFITYRLVILYRLKNPRRRYRKHQ